AASCHTGGQGPRFAPPQKPWTANLPPVILGWHVPAQRPDVPGYRERASLRAIAPPLRPPSLLA
ncbi:MAG: hypothetical protein JWM80_526, partial [Cyanobacteria bacterium RYN_339]|nr:hypothetical protein [Cyanobacteria bacterium RYN_339]